MTNIGTGHWIFAGVFAVVFVGAIIWSFIKDKNVTKVHYNKSVLFILTVIVLMFLMFIFREYLR